MKLASRYYGLFSILKRVGKVAYTLQLPEGPRLHPTFHVSLLKRKVEATATVYTRLPEVDDLGELWPLSEKAMFFKWRRRGPEMCKEVLIKWSGLSDNHNLWVVVEELMISYHEFNLEDKLISEEEGNIISSNRFGLNYQRRDPRRAEPGPVQPNST